MGLIKISPPAVLSPKVARFSQAVANSNVKAKANGDDPGATEPPLPLTPQRLELIKAYAERRSPNADGVPASRIARRFAPRAPEGAPPGKDRPAPHAQPAAPLAALASGIRTLTAVLIIAALLPNLTLAAFWLRLIDTPWSEPAARPPSESPLPAVREPIPPPVLSTQSALEASAGDDVSLPIALDGTDGVPARSIIVISGLPQGSKLSSGNPHGETEWTLKPDEIGDLHLLLPDAASGEAKLTIELVAPGDRVIADASTLLKVTPAPTVSAGAFAIETEPREVQASDQPAQEVEAGANDVTAAIDSTPVESDLPPLPTRRPTPLASDDGSASWVRPSAYVNLREGPSSTSSVVGVVAKGTKLRVMGRKRGWVQVGNPATSNSGWIYSGNVETVR